MSGFLSFTFNFPFPSYGPEQPKFPASNNSFSHELGSECASKWTHECNGACKQSEQYRASKWVSGASERANRRASGPVLQSVFLAVLDHSAPPPKKKRRKRIPHNTSSDRLTNHESFPWHWTHSILRVSRFFSCIQSNDFHAFCFWSMIDGEKAVRATFFISKRPIFGSLRQLGGDLGRGGRTQWSENAKMWY